MRRIGQEQTSEVHRLVLLVESDKDMGNRLALNLENWDKSDRMAACRNASYLHPSHHIAGSRGVSEKGSVCQNPLDFPSAFLLKFEIQWCLSQMLCFHHNA